MKTFARFFTIVCLILALVVAPIMIAQAAPAQLPASQTAVIAIQPQDPAPATLPDLVKTLEALGGWALLVPALVNVGKKTGIVKDGQAPAWSLGLNTAGLVTLVVLQLTGRSDMVPMLDSNAGALALVINAVLGLVLQLYVSRKGHDEIFAGMPVVGTSYSGRRAGEGPAIEYAED